MRASDSDRERVAEILRDAHGEGRLNQDELMLRLEATYAARTYQDLDGVIDDLPVVRRPAVQVADQVNRRPRSAPVPQRRFTPRRMARVFLNINWWAYGAAVALCVVIWFLIFVATDNGMQYLWPLWVAGPWGVLLAAGELGYRSKWPSDRPPSSP